MISFIFPSHAPEYLPPSDVEARLQRYATALDSLRNLQRYHDALEMIRDHSSDVAAVALANNVLMGFPTDFGFYFSPLKAKFQ